MTAKTQPGAIPALLPCPFCGGPAETWTLDCRVVPEGDDGEHQGGCAVACAETPWCETVEEVAAWWNRRADRASHPDQPEGPGVVERNPTRDQIAAVMFQAGTREQQVEALDYMHGKLPSAPPSDRIRQETAEERIREDAERAASNERLRFEGNLDDWMKILGAGVTGYQPEAYAVMDAACRELVRARAALAEAAEDERDRLYKHATIDFPFERFAGPASAWLRERVAMLPADRAAKRTDGDR